jgi:hypothetical protein
MYPLNLPIYLRITTFRHQITQVARAWQNLQNHLIHKFVARASNPEGFYCAGDRHTEGAKPKTGLLVEL